MYHYYYFIYKNSTARLYCTFQRPKNKFTNNHSQATIHVQIATRRGRMRIIERKSLTENLSGRMRYRNEAVLNYFLWNK